MLKLTQDNLKKDITEINQSKEQEKISMQELRNTIESLSSKRDKLTEEIKYKNSQLTELYGLDLEHKNLKIAFAEQNCKVQE